VERVAIPKGEWNNLLKAMHRDHGFDPGEMTELQGKLVQFEPEEAKESLAITLSIGETAWSWCQFGTAKTSRFMSHPTTSISQTIWLLYGTCSPESFSP
jgi:hypothetical protein